MATSDMSVQSCIKLFNGTSNFDDNNSYLTAKQILHWD